MYKIATLGSGNPRNFTWNIISNNNVVMPTGGCTVDSRNVTVESPGLSGSAEIPLAYIAQANKSSHFIFRVPPLTVAEQVFANTAPDATKNIGSGCHCLMRLNGKILATRERERKKIVPREHRIQKQSTSGFKRNLCTDQETRFQPELVRSSHWCQLSSMNNCDFDLSLRECDSRILPRIIIL